MALINMPFGKKYRLVLFWMLVGKWLQFDRLPVHWGSITQISFGPLWLHWMKFDDYDVAHGRE